MRGDEIDFAGRVRDVTVAAVLHLVAKVAITFGALDLHAPESAAPVDDDVVALAFAPGLGDAQAEVGGAGEERGLSGFAEALAARLGDSLDFDSLFRALLVVGGISVSFHDKKSAAGLRLG